jgi:hypothetical protein
MVDVLATFIIWVWVKFKPWNQWNPRPKNIPTWLDAISKSLAQCMFSNGDLGWMLTLKNLANLWENVVRYEKNMGNGGKIHYKWRCRAAKSIELSGGFGKSKPCLITG